MYGAISAGQLKSQPTVSLNFLHNSHVHRDVTNLENPPSSAASDQFPHSSSRTGVCCLPGASFLLAPGIFPLILHAVTLSTGFFFSLWALGK